MALPSNVTFGTVIGVFLLAVGDYPDDVDRDPQGIPASDLKIRFTPDLSPAVARDSSSSPPTFFALQDVIATVGGDGALLGPDGAPGVRLVATSNTALQPNGWTWQVVLSGTGFPTIKFSFVLDPGATVDLAQVLQVPANPGATLNAWLNAVAAAQAAQAAAEAAAASVPSAASLATTSVMLWKPSTTYAVGQSVLNPSGFVVTAATAHTSGATYDSTNWVDAAVTAYTPRTGTTVDAGAPKYGLVADFSTTTKAGTDNTAGIQSAINDAGPGGRVLLPPGRFACGALTVGTAAKNGLVIEGSSDSSGTRLYFTPSTGTLFTNGTDSGNAYDSNEYNGPEGFALRRLYIATANPSTVTDGGQESGATWPFNPTTTLLYQPGTYAIRDWRGGYIRMDDVRIRGFDWWFWGIQSDLDTFRNIEVQCSHSGAYIGPRSDQLTIESSHILFNDRVLDIDSAAGARFISCSFVDNGNATTAPVRVQAAFTRGANMVAFIACWVEHFLGPATVTAFCEAGVTGGAAAAIRGVRFVNTTIMTNTAASATPHLKYLLQVGAASQIMLDEVGHNGAYGFDGLINVVGANSPDILVMGWTGYVANATLGVVNSGTGNPNVSKWAYGSGSTLQHGGNLNVSGTIYTSSSLAANAGITSGADTRAAVASFNTDAAAGQIKRWLAQTAGKSRWAVQSNATAESGSNAGSDLEIVAYADDGTTQISKALTIERKTGVVTFAVPQGFGIPATVDVGAIRSTDNAGVGTANQAIYMRVREGGTISKIGVSIAVSSGNFSVAVYRNSGVGAASVRARSSRPRIGR
jgi:hypothetical protein